LRNGLIESGFVVDVAEDGTDALFLATNGEYDLIILDIMLPQTDGWSILRSLRCAGKQTPILCATACDAVPDRVKGLELGADDYLVKPFTFAEFLARVRSLLRRVPARTAETLRLADLTIDLLQRKVARGGQRIDLTAHEFKLLELLMRRAGEILPRTLIADQVWDINFHSDSNVVDVAIKRLRRKVDKPFEARLIHSVRGVGYVLEAR
jgi:two-component system copper resistance phosphate regulon response regulator CusR